nr:probable polyamine oxidase 4 [Ipomoea batatas]
MIGTFTSHTGRQYKSSPSVIVIGGAISGLAIVRVLQNVSFKMGLVDVFKLTARLVALLTWEHRGSMSLVI